jgi:peptide/nickel transport system permease protein
VLRYLIRRILSAVLVIFGVSIITFGSMFLSGDPATALAGDNWSRQQIDDFRHLMGFDRPWYVQYGDYIDNVLHGNLGTSLRQYQPVSSLLIERVPATVQLTGAALCLSIVLSVPIGVISAARRNSAYDRLAMLFALAGQSMPVFWVGTMLILIFGVALQWLPVAGAGDLSHLILPAITLGLFSVARNARLVRSSMLEVLGADYVRTARAKGLPGRLVLIRHAFRNALLPIVTVFGLDVGALVGGAVITETIFAWPGVGRMTVDAVLGKDLPLVQGAVLLLAGSFVFINLLVDLLYGYLDPRVRLA